MEGVCRVDRVGSWVGDEVEIDVFDGQARPADGVGHDGGFHLDGVFGGRYGEVGGVVGKDGCRGYGDAFEGADDGCRSDKGCMC